MHYSLVHETGDEVRNFIGTFTLVFLLLKYYVACLNVVTLFEASAIGQALRVVDNIMEDFQPQLPAAKLFLLYHDNCGGRPVAQAIAERVQRPSIAAPPGHMVFKILEIVIDAATRFAVGDQVAWQSNRATDGMGSTAEEIKLRLPGLINYLKDRGHQKMAYEKLLQSRPELAVGDKVLLPIPRVDRSNTCAKNVVCQVVGKEGKRVWLGTEAGKIEHPYLQEQLCPLKGNKIPRLEIPEKTIPLTTALRSVTSYGKPVPDSLCHCKKQCSSRHCMCFKNGLKCSTKCHKGHPDCSNK